MTKEELLSIEKSEHEVQKMGAIGRRAAQWITVLRQDSGMTYAELARRTGGVLNEIAIRRIERLERRIDVDDLFVIAEALGVDPTALLSVPEDRGARGALAMSMAAAERESSISKLLIEESKRHARFVEQLRALNG